jgi:peroxiredoxin
MQAVKRQEGLVILISLIVLSAGFYFIFLKNDKMNSERRSGSGPKVGEVAPDFMLPKLGGGAVSLADYRGKTVFLNFWATWCPPCVAEVPSMEKLYRKLKGPEFEILAVSVDGEGEKTIPPFLAKHSLTFPVLLDPDKKIYGRYGLTGIPETFIIDKNGAIDLKIIGAQDWTERKWLNYFDRIIGKKGET